MFIMGRMNTTQAPTVSSHARPHRVRPLEVPVSGQTLRQALERHDTRALMDFAHQLRVAGYKVDPQQMATQLLSNGCAWVDDAFGQRVSLQVQVPQRPASQSQRPDESVSFRIAA